MQRFAATATPASNRTRYAPNVKPPPVAIPLLAALLVGCDGSDTDPSAEQPIPHASASAAGSLGGVVTGPAGPVADAYLTLAPGGQEARSDAAGAYSFPRLPPAAYTLVVAAPGLDTATVGPAIVTADADATLDVALAEATPTDGWLEIAVRGPIGEVRTNATVTVEGPDGDVSANTDEDGVARVSGLAGSTVVVKVEDADTGLWIWSASGVVMPAHGNRHLDATLSGRSPDGTPYVGRSLCVMCHDSPGDLHANSAHENAATSAPPADVLAAFTAGRVVDLGGPTATLSMNGATPHVRLTATDAEVLDADVAAWIGADSVVPWVVDGTDGYALPVAWVGAEPQRATFPDGRRFVPWRTDAWFDASGVFDQTDGSEFPSAPDAGCISCHMTGVAGAETELGVGCEACHGAGLAHASSTQTLMAFKITNPALLDVDAANGVCARCHGGTEEHVPFAGGHASDPGHQIEELRRSAHGDDLGWQQRCVDCHSPHGSKVASASLRLDSRDNTLCLSCHAALSDLADEASIVDHTGHFVYQPASILAAGRCTGCHMPKTAARVAYGPLSGGGDLASHRFTVIPPSETLAAFDDAGEDVLPLGAFPSHGCQQCHGYIAWSWETDFGFTFPGPFGDATQRSTHEAFDDAYQGMFP